MANQANLKPSLEQSVARHAGRIKRLREAIVKAEQRQDLVRVESLHTELVRRLASLESVRASVTEALNDS